MKIKTQKYFEAKFKKKNYEKSIKVEGYEIYSMAEKKILLYLLENNIKFEKEKKFDVLGNLRFDFYIEDKNLLIEYQGKQHYTPIKKFGGKKQFEIQKANDLLKENFCLENKINLLCLPYTLTWDEIYQILSKKLK